MYESSVIQHFTEQGIKQGIEQGIKQGERKAAIESLLDVLDVRFQSSEVQTLNPIIESIEELPHLRELLVRRFKCQVLMNSGASYHQMGRTLIVNGINLCLATAESLKGT